MKYRLWHSVRKKRKVWFFTGLLFLLTVFAGIVIYFLSQSADRELPRGTLVKAVCWEGEADE